MFTNTTIIIYALAALITALTFFVIRNEMRLRKIFAGKKAVDLETVISSLVEEVNRLDRSEEKIKNHIQNIESRLKKSIQGVSTVRFNALRDTGGNQSFAVAFLNEEGDGAIISSIYSREFMNVFAKPIKNHISEYGLSNEEKEALRQAQSKRA